MLYRLFPSSVPQTGLEQAGKPLRIIIFCDEYIIRTCQAVNCITVMGIYSPKRCFFKKGRAMAEQIIAENRSNGDTSMTFATDIRIVQFFKSNRLAT